MNWRKLLQFLFLMILMLSFCNCSKFLSDLRRDPNDPEQTRSGISSNDDVPPPQMGRDDRDRLLSEREELPSEADSSDRFNPSDESNIISSARYQTLEPEKKRRFKNGLRATRDDFVDQSQEEGSLWASNGQTNYYFTKNKIRSPGDIISLSIENDLSKELASEIKKTLSPRERALEIKLVQDQIRARYLSALDKGTKDSISLNAASPEKAASNGSGAARPDAQASPGVSPLLPPILSEQEAELKMARTTLDDVDMLSALGVKVGDTMMGEIVERYPNGNYKIRATKKINYKRGSPRIVSVLGVVKSTDINEETDTVNSGKLYEYRVEISY